MRNVEIMEQLGGAEAVLAQDGTVLIADSGDAAENAARVRRALLTFGAEKSSVPAPMHKIMDR